MKKALGWSKVALFTLDTGSDVYVGVDLINRCHYKYAMGVFSFFWLPGLLSGGLAAYILGEKVLEGKNGRDVTCCEAFLLFVLGTVFGPLVFIPGGLYLLIKSAIDPEDGFSRGAVV